MDDFVTWALSPDLDLEEAFCAELLTEKGVEIWKSKNKIDDPNRYNWEFQKERRRARYLNPAHRAVLSEVDVMHAAEVLPTFTDFNHWCYDSERSLRNLSGLRFCPALTKFQVAPTSLPDLAWLRFVPGLVSFWLQDHNVEDYSDLNRCQNLKDIHLWLHFSWCDLRSLAELSQLEEIGLHGNLPTLANVGPLPKVLKVHMNGFGHGRAYLRNAGDLPDMPLLKDAYIVPWASLEGIEKFAALENLTTEGSFLDLSPLTRLPSLQKLVIGGERFTTLAPLAQVPQLAVIQLCREMPIDFTPLLESESLRELRPKYGEERSPEMIGLNAALCGWERDYLLSEPRPLPEPFYRISDHLPDADPYFVRTPAPRVLDPGEAVHEAEAKWVAQRLAAAVNKVFGDADWGEASADDHQGHRCEVSLELSTLEACDRLIDVVAVCRQQLAWLKNRWSVRLTTSPMAEWEKDPDEWKNPAEREFQEHMEEARDYVERRRQYLAFLERLREFRLRQELGEPTSPENFAAPPAPDEEEEEDESDVLDSGDDWDQRYHPLWHDYYMTIIVCEEGIWASAGFKRKPEKHLLHRFEVAERMREEYEKADDD